MTPDKTIQDSETEVSLSWFGFGPNVVPRNDETVANIWKELKVAVAILSLS